MLIAKVLGTKAETRAKLAARVERVARRAGLQVVVEQSDDVTEIERYRAVLTPALVIADELVASGKLPTEAKIHAWLLDAAIRA